MKDGTYSLEDYVGDLRDITVQSSEDREIIGNPSTVVQQ